MTENIIAPTAPQERTPERIGAEIRSYIHVGRQVTVLCGIEIGRRLCEAKDMLPHGEWLPWLKKETDLQERTAQRYMTVFREYGADQLWLLEPETNASSLSDLPISKALALLSVPESDREAFAEEVGAAELSTEELKEAIRQKKEAEERAKAAEESAAETKKRLEALEADLKDAEEQSDDFSRENERLTEELKEAKKRAAELENRPIEVAVERDEAAITEAVNAARAEAEQERAALLKKLEEAKKKQEKAEKERDALKAQAAEAGDAAKAATAAAEKQAADKLAAAEAETAQVRAELEKARKALAASDKDVTEFGVHFKAMQAELRALGESLERVRARDGALADKLSAALGQVLNNAEFGIRNVESEG